MLCTTATNTSNTITRLGGVDLGGPEERPMGQDPHM